MFISEHTNSRMSVNIDIELSILLSMLYNQTYMYILHQILYYYYLLLSSVVHCIGEGGGITARLRFKAPWLENCVRQDCEISHSE